MLLDENGRCEYCNPAAFVSTRLAKQHALMGYLDSRYLTGTSTDKILLDGQCGRERPDRVYELADKILVLECDEDQHKYRSCECEQTRMINIAQSYGGTPVYFIRWNPDKYNSETNCKQASMLQRYKVVGDLIQGIIESRIALPHCLMAVCYLYYDGWANTIDWSIVQALETI
jgi:hypothetical protein